MEPVTVYTLAQVADMTGWNADSIRRDCKNGVYDHTKRGKHYGMTMAQIEAMVARHRVPASASAAPANAEASGIEAVLALGASRFRRRGAAA